MFNVFFVDSHWSCWLVQLCVQRPAKANYYACIAMPTWRRCGPPILFLPWPPYNLLPRSWFSMSILTDGYHFACSAQQSHALSTNYHTCIAMPTWCRCDICFYLDLHITCSRGRDFLCRSSLMGTTLRAVPNKLYTILTNYHVYIAMPTWYTCTPILFRPTYI